MYANLFKSLNDGEVEFLVLGVAAVCLHGFARMTEAIDILLKNTSDNVERFVAVASKWGSGCASDLEIEHFQGPGAVRIVEDFPLDVFTLVDGRSYESFAGNAVRHEIGGGIIVPSFSIADLIEVKSKTLRERDELDVTVLRRLQAQPETAAEAPSIMLDRLPGTPPANESEVPPR